MPLQQRERATHPFSTTPNIHGLFHHLGPVSKRGRTDLSKRNAHGMFRPIHIRPVRTRAWSAAKREWGWGIWGRQRGGRLSVITEEDGKAILRGARRGLSEPGGFGRHGGTSAEDLGERRHLQWVPDGGPCPSPAPFKSPCPLASPPHETFVAVVSSPPHTRTHTERC